MASRASSSAAPRPTGIDAVGAIPWGTHLCQFYATREDLIETLVPWFANGLASREFCLWVTSPPLEAPDAWRALGAAVPDLRALRREGRIDVVPYDEWYLRGGAFEPERVLDAWVRALERAQARGYEGMRLTGNTFWLEKKDWRSFAEYEAAVDDVLGRYEMLALCTYSLERCGAAEIADVLRTHQFALLKRDGAWDLIESRGRRETDAAQETAWHRERREARRANAELQRSLRRFELLAGTAGDLLQGREPQRQVNALCARVMDHLDCHVFVNFLVDEESGRLHLNACAGVPPEEARRVEWLDLGAAVCGCVAESGRRIVAESVQSGGDPRTEIVRSWGVRAYACHPLLGPGGRVLGTLSFGTRSRDAFGADDLSLMKAVADQVAVAMVRLRDEEALRRSEEALREADRRKDEFLAVLSHELRNPLAPIANGLHVLERAEPGGERARRAREVIGRQVKQLSHLVDDLLDVTRITRNKISLQRGRVELNELVRRAAEDQRSLFERSGIDLEVVPAPRPLAVDADPTRIAQVVGNLLQNAVKFTPAGGRTTVALREEAGRALVSVADDGVGMTAATIAGLFQPFVQADMALDRGTGGLGLGLALVKGLVELHGGTVSARSDGPGRGAEFLFSIPLAAEAGDAPAGEAAPRRVPRRRVLIIEDNLDAADTLREALEMGEHEVAVTHSGADGVRCAAELRPDVVLCDIGLPGMDGYEVARAIRADETLRRVRLVALSGYATPEDQRRAADAGFDHHLAKPADLRKIEDVLAGG